MSKKKILWSGDIVAMTGFARVTENLISRLKDEYEIVVLGNNWWGDPTPWQKDFLMYPSSNRFQTACFGEERIREIIENIKPDLVFVNNDMWIVNELYKRIQDYHQEGRFKFVAYCPMDSYNWLGCLGDFANAWDAVVCYTEFGAHEFLKGGINRPIAVIPHGVTTGQFAPMDKLEARKALGLSSEDFIVFNGNRNQFRKRIDITIAGFAKFAVGKPDAKLYLHMGMKDQGWDILPVFMREMNKNGLDANNRIIMTHNNPNPPNVDVETLNRIYNAVDVGVNTCKGEGHGLVNHEHASCRVAQVVPDHTSCKEIFEGTGKLIRCDHIDVDVNYAREMPCPSVDHLAEILTELYENRAELDAVAERCYIRATDEKYSWDTIAHQFKEIFDDALQGNQISLVQVEEEHKKKKKKSKGRERRLIGAVS